MAMKRNDGNGFFKYLGPFKWQVWASVVGLVPSLGIIIATMLACEDWLQCRQNFSWKSYLAYISKSGWFALRGAVNQS